MPIWMKAGWVVFCLTVFWILEGYYKLFSLSYKKWKHAKTNLLFLLFVMIINAIFGIIATGVFVWLSKTQFGIFQLFEGSVWVELILSIVVLDLIAQYSVHYLLHKVKWMWRLHLIHHSDKNIDTTSGTRRHPFDFIIRESFALIAIVIMGMPIAFYFIYRILSVLFTYFTHANISMPLWLDRTLSTVIVTPNMHKFHHHYKLPWTDSNYGNILAVWDRLFGTFVSGNLHDIRYGIDIAQHIDDESFLKQLQLPFNKTVKSKNT